MIPTKKVYIPITIPNFIFSHNSFIFKGFPSFTGSLRTISAPFCPSSAGFPFCLENPDSAQHEVLGDVHIAIHGGFNTRVTKQFLKRLWRHAIFDSASCISMPQGVHTEALYPRLITKLIEVGVIGTVFAGSPVRQFTKTRSCINRVFFSPVRRSMYSRQHDMISASFRS